MGHNIELLRKQEMNSRKPSEDLTMYSQKALLCLAGKSQKRLRNRSNKIIYCVDKQLILKVFLRKQCKNNRFEFDTISIHFSQSCANAKTSILEPRRL